MAAAAAAAVACPAAARAVEDEGAGTVVPSVVSVQGSSVIGACVAVVGLGVVASAEPAAAAAAVVTAAITTGVEDGNTAVMWPVFIVPVDLATMAVLVGFGAGPEADFDDANGPEAKDEPAIGLVTAAGRAAPPPVGSVGAGVTGEAVTVPLLGVGVVASGLSVADAEPDDTGTGSKETAGLDGVEAGVSTATGAASLVGTDAIGAAGVGIAAVGAGVGDEIDPVALSLGTKDDAVGGAIGCGTTAPAAGSATVEPSANAPPGDMISVRAKVAMVVAATTRTRIGMRRRPTASKPRSCRTGCFIRWVSHSPGEGTSARHPLPRRTVTR
jgi:hypothetical protein